MDKKDAKTGMLVKVISLGSYGGDEEYVGQQATIVSMFDKYMSAKFSNGTVYSLGYEGVEPVEEPKPPQAKPPKKARAVDSLSSAIESAVEEAIERRLRTKTIVVVKDGKKKERAKHDITGQHFKLELLLACIRAGLNTALVGGAGTGKTTATEVTATILARAYSAMSFCRLTSKADILGYIDAGGTYRGTEFRKRYEVGGVFCGDEFDAGNENVNVVLNAALSNGLCAFPDGMVKRHQDFVCIICMNTYGFGGNRVYVGRNQLDAATMDRFVTIDWDLDEQLEASLVGLSAEGSALKMADGGIKTPQVWRNRVLSVRKAVEKAGVRHIVSPRAILFGVKLFEQGVGAAHVEEMVLWKGLDAEQRARVEKAVKEVA